MENRFRLESHKNGILVEHTSKLQLEDIRKSDGRFKGCHIKDIIQALPSTVDIGKVYDIKY